MLSDGSPQPPGHNTAASFLLNTLIESRSRASNWTVDTQDEEENEFENEDETEEMGYQNGERTPSLSSSSSHTSDNISEPETQPDSQPIPLPLPSFSRDNSSGASTLISSTASQTGTPPQPFQRSRAPSPQSYVPTEEGTPERTGNRDNGGILEWIEDDQDGEELEEEEDEGDERRRR